MVADEDGGADGVQVVIWVIDGEGRACREPHNVFEAARCGPLRDAAVADQTEEERDEDAVRGADDEREVGGEQAGEEAGQGKADGEHEEEDGEGEEEDDHIEEVTQDGGHGGEVWWPARASGKAMNGILLQRVTLSWRG